MSPQRSSQARIRGIGEARARPGHGRSLADAGILAGPRDELPHREQHHGPTNAITAEGLVKIYKSRKSEVRALDGIDLEVAEGTVLGLLGPERRRQDDHGPDPGDAAQAGRRARDGRRLRRRQAGRRAPPGHRAVRPVRRGRREPDRAREPVDVRPAVPAAVARGHASGPPSCSSSSTSPTPAIASSRRTRAACAAGSTSAAP